MKSHYDVLIIGSGASGGTVAYTLARKGISCVMLDAGTVIDYAKDRTLKKVYELPYRGFDKPGRFPHVTQANEFNGNLWADEKENPYTYDPNDPYYWVRVRLVGGKTLVWGRASWRMCDLQFRSKDHDGFGENWPIRYQDLAPYYDKVEPLWRVSGRREGLPQIRTAFSSKTLRTTAKAFSDLYRRRRRAEYPPPSLGGRPARWRAQLIYCCRPLSRPDI